MLIYENKEEGASGFRVANVISVAGLGDCTAEAPFDAAQDRRRAQRISPKNSNLNKPSVNSLLLYLKGFAT